MGFLRGSLTMPNCRYGIKIASYSIVSPLVVKRLEQLLISRYDIINFYSKWLHS